ncbi:MAG: HNH endonuclease [Aquincola sp.]|nr:HNH endonuclease [Aquincola sp.]
MISYKGKRLSDKQKTFLTEIAHHGCRPRVSGHASKTLRIMHQDRDLGYLNDTVTDKGGVVGYRFEESFPPTDSCPTHLLETFPADFCRRLGCERADFLFYEGSGANRNHWYLIVLDLGVALRMIEAKLANPAAQGTDDDFLVVDRDDRFVEGAITDVTMQSRERSRAARQACLNEYGFDCLACGVNLKKLYGLERELIHVHHEVPLASFEGAHDVNAAKDLKPLCPNCHAAAHSDKNVLTVREIQRRLDGHRRRSSQARAEPPYGA